MNKKTLKNKLRLYIAKYGCFLLFVLSVVVSLVTTYYVTGNVLDSDASSEMILAHQLAQTGKIMTMDWLYSTEIRVLNSQLVFALFFHFFEDWHMVRFCSAVLLQGVMVATYWFMLNRAGIRKQTIWLCEAMLLLPVSVTYGRIVLYHSHYIMHILLAFLLIGMFFAFADGIRWKKVGTYVNMLLIMGLSFIGGLAGVRHLMVIHAPLLLSIVLLCFVEDFKEEDCKKASLLSSQKLQLLLCVVLMAAASLAGVIINKVIFSKYFSFLEYTETTMELLGAADFSDLLYGFFHQFGYRKGQSLLSLMGILSLPGLVAGCYCVVSSVKKLIQHEKKHDIKKAIIDVFFLSFTIVMLALFLLTGGEANYYFVLYLSLSYPWVISNVVEDLQTYKSKGNPLNVRCIFYWITFACLWVNGFANIGFYLGNETFDQHYEGLIYNNVKCVEQKVPVISFLRENDYTIGYATYWEANVMTEISDGNIQMINLLLDKETGNIEYYNWLTSLYVREIPNEKPFILVTQDEKTIFEQSDSFQFCTFAYEDEYHCVYDISAMDAFIPSLYY